MPRSGRNEPCPCGSHRKAKRCCGVRRGPGEDQLARAYVASLARAAAWELADTMPAGRRRLFEALLDLPQRDLSLLVTLPTLISPELARLRQAIARDDPDWGWDALTAVAEQVDTPQQRAQLALALVDLRDQGRVDPRQAAAAIINLASRSTRFIAASLIQAVAISVGVERTPGGLQIAA